MFLNENRTPTDIYTKLLFEKTENFLQLHLIKYTSFILYVGFLKNYMYFSISIKYKLHPISD